MLSDRRQRVLAALIEEYVARALPVGSKTLTERYSLGVSSATVRNELSVLEDGGYIIQPHTSAGRIPTDTGYRAFVDQLLNSGVIHENGEHQKIYETIKSQATELDSLLELTTATLSRLTDCLSIVLAPSIMALNLKQISLLSLTPFRALVILVTEDGQVFNRQIEFDFEVDATELARVQGLLTSVIVGKSMSEAESEIADACAHALNDPLSQLILYEVLACLKDSGAAHSHHLGLNALLAKPEFSHTDAVLPVLEILDNDLALLEVLDEAQSSDSSDPTVRIGAENLTEGLEGVSVVAKKYGQGSSAGVVAVIGPTRMDYSTVISAVHHAGASLESL